MMSSGMEKQSTTTLDCPKSMVGRVIGKNGETIKALQTYTGALIQIDQTVDPTKVTISGMKHNLDLAASMVTDIMKGTFKGFALLRTLPGGPNAPVGPNGIVQQRPVYAPGYGLIPPSQLYGPSDRLGAPMPDPTKRAMPGGWLGAQGAPSQMLLGMQGVRPMAPGMIALGVADEAMLMGYGHMGMAPMYGYPADYGMQGMGRADMLYGGGHGPMGGMGGGLGGGMGGGGGIGSSHRMYQAAGARGGGGGGAGGMAGFDGPLGGSRGHNLMSAAAGGGGGGLDGGGRNNGPAGGAGAAGLAASGWLPSMDASGAMYAMPPDGVLQQQG